MIIYFTLVEKELIINTIRKIGDLVENVGHYYMLESRKWNIVRFYMALVWEGLETVMKFDFICVNEFLKYN